MQDNQNFRWLSSSSCVSVESSGNTCVIEGLTSGSSRITVSNPKSLYPASFMVYVPDSDREVFYLTTSSNVVKSYVGSTVSFDVSCVGGSQSDLVYNSFTVTEGAENVTVTHSQGTFSVTGKAVGQSLIEVKNPKSFEPLYVRVVVSENKNFSYVEVERDVMVLSGDLGTTVTTEILSGNTDCIYYEDYNGLNKASYSGTLSSSLIWNSIYKEYILKGVYSVDYDKLSAGESVKARVAYSHPNMEKDLVVNMTFTKKSD